MGHIYHNEVAFNWVYSFHMPLFFFAAGYVYKEKKIGEDIIKRIKTIVVPYYILGGLVFVYWFLIERKFRETQFSTGQTFLGFLIGQYNISDFNVHLWFLPAFFVTVVFLQHSQTVLWKKSNHSCGRDS